MVPVMSKQELHPKDYRYVVFADEAAKFSFLTKSTAKSEEIRSKIMLVPALLRLKACVYDEAWSVTTSSTTSLLSTASAGR